MMPGLQNGDKNTLTTPYCPTWRSTMSSHADSGHGWSEGDTGPAEEMTGKQIKKKMILANEISFCPFNLLNICTMKYY